MIVRAKVIVFHNHRYYNPGDEVDLSEKAAKRLLECGEVEPVRKKRAVKKTVPEGE